MLLMFSVSNYLSFQNTETLNMLPASFENTQIISNEHILKSALIFGANAAGKSNFIRALSLVKTIILKSNAELTKNYLKDVTKFALSDNTANEPSTFEVTILIKNIVYQYTLSIFNHKISYEKLQLIDQDSEMLEDTLFERQYDQLTIISPNFTESHNFYNTESNNIQQTKENVPFISVLAGSGGKHSSNLIQWFNSLQILSGLEDENFLQYSLELFENNEEFQEWALQFLPSMQIEKIEFKEDLESIVDSVVIKKDLEELKSRQAELSLDEQKKLVIFEKMLEIITITDEMSDEQIHKKTIRVIKNIANKKYSLPFSVESSGTKKLIALLGPIYDSLQNNNVLVCDEIDSKFHTLLMKYIFTVFHRETRACQLIATAQDVNLIDTKIFTNDQIWFVDKNEFGASNLYSLIEFKNQPKNQDYNFLYLSGAYSAIPLFPNSQEIKNLMEE